ncbi:unnamed protein product [Prunus armeniaca]
MLLLWSKPSNIVALSQLESGLVRSAIDEIVFPSFQPRRQMEGTFAEQGTSSQPRFFHYIGAKALCEQPNDVEWVEMKIEGET